MIRLRKAFLILTAAGVFSMAQAAIAQRPPETPISPQAAAPMDLTGQWVSVITEDWRWRMVTPAKGDYMSVPLNPAGEAAADAWDLEADNAAGLQCKAFGAGGLLRVPGRIRISWQDEETLRLESDAGQQVRLFHFINSRPGNILPALDDPAESAGEPSWQGYSKAQWYKQVQARGLGYGGSPGEGGALRAVTQNVRAGYLRSNGVPYSADAVITDQFNVFEYAGQTWLVVTTIVEDPANLTQPFITSSNFRKETDRSGWSPSPCRTDPPLAPPMEK